MSYSSAKSSDLFLAETPSPPRKTDGGEPCSDEWRLPICKSQTSSDLNLFYELLSAAGLS